MIDWEKLWLDFDASLRYRHSNGTWEGQKAIIEKLVNEQIGNVEPFDTMAELDKLCDLSPQEDIDQ